MRRSIVPVLTVLLLAGCATTQPGHSAGAAGEAPSSVLETSSQARILYNLLVAEFSGQRGDVGRAAEAYVDAAAESADPAVAERAARVAFYAERPALARQAAQRWEALAPDSGEPHRLLALLALRQGEVDEAYERLRASLPGDPQGREAALARLGATVARQAPGETAIRALRRLATALPDSRMAHYALAQVALESGQPEVALTATESALGLSEGWRAARLLRVDALFAAGRNDAALGELENLLAGRPGDFELRLRFARTLVDLARRDQALAQFRRLLEQRPRDARVLYAGALLAIDQGQNDQATHWLQRLLELGQRTDAAAYYLGRIAEREGRFDRARGYYSRAGGNYNQDAQLRLAAMEAAEGGLGAALSRLRELRAANPQSAVDTWAAQGRILRDAGRPADSVDAYTRGLSEHEGNIDLLYGRAMSYISLDRVEEAEADLRAILEQEPENVHALNALGYTLADRTERYREAEQLISRAYALEPRDPAIIDSMGWVAYRLGRLEAAERYLREAYELSKDPEIAAHLGEVLWQMGRREAARDVWLRALERNPDATVVTETMERLAP